VTCQEMAEILLLKQWNVLFQNGGLFAIQNGGIFAV